MKEEPGQIIQPPAGIRVFQPAGPGPPRHVVIPPGAEIHVDDAARASRGYVVIVWRGATYFAAGADLVSLDHAIAACARRAAAST
jgi:hypothetical protein